MNCSVEMCVRGFGFVLSWPLLDFFIYEVTVEPYAQAMPLSLKPRVPQNSLKTMIAFQLHHLHTGKLNPVRENAQGYKRWMERPFSLFGRVKVHVHVQSM